MSQFSFDSEALEEAESEPQFELQADAQFDPLFKPQEEPQAPEPVAEPEAEAVAEPVAQSATEPETLALSVDDFAALEERILRAVNLVKRERLARAAAEERATQAEALLAEQTPKVEQLQSEVSKLHAERDQVRQRVERLLAQLDVLEL